MSTKNATWSKWPARWLKSLPNVEAEGREGADSDIGIGSPSKNGSEAQKGSQGAPAAIFRFEDFVERPLRSSTQRQEQGRGRGHGEGTGDGGGPDGGDGAGNQP